MLYCLCALSRKHSAATGYPLAVLSILVGSPQPEALLGALSLLSLRFLSRRHLIACLFTLSFWAPTAYTHFDRKTNPL